MRTSCVHFYWYLLKILKHTANFFIFIIENNSTKWKVSHIMVKTSWCSGEIQCLKLTSFFHNCGVNFFQQVVKLCNTHVIRLKKLTWEVSKIWIQCVKFSFSFPQLIQGMYPYFSRQQLHLQIQVQQNKTFLAQFDTIHSILTVADDFLNSKHINKTPEHIIYPVLSRNQSTTNGCNTHIRFSICINANANAHSE